MFQSSKWILSFLVIVVLILRREAAMGATSVANIEDESTTTVCQSNVSQSTARQLNLLGEWSKMMIPGNDRNQQDHPTQKSSGPMSPSNMLDSVVKGTNAFTKLAEAATDRGNPLERMQKVSEATSEVAAAATGTNNPLKQFQKMTEATSKLAAAATGTNDPLQQFQKMTEVTSKIVSAITGAKSPILEPGDTMYHKNGRTDHGDLESDIYRPPKYFSRECQFRFACEIGKLVKPIPPQYYSQIEQSKFIHDIQNRYTTAWTYGMIHDNCGKYYCLLVQLMGGPKQFVGAIVELLNRLANPDQYEKK